MSKLLPSLTILILTSFLITASAAIFNVKLRDSNGGQSLVYSEASLTFEDGGTIAASHDGAGNFVVNISGNSVKVKMYYQGVAQSATINADYTFNTVRVTADLKESDGDSITSSANWQYRFGWGAYTSFDPITGVELLPVNTKIKVTYLGASVEKQQNTQTNSHLNFNTIKLTASLEESDNNDITGAASWEYRFGWGTHIAFDPIVGVELLPVNTKVKVSYLGASVEKQQNTKTNSHLDFNTIKLTASLVESDNDDITASATWEYRFGWGTHMAFDPLVGVELLPVNTKVKVSYLGASVEKQQNTKTNSHLDFNTIKLTASLVESDNDDITASATWEYRFGWGTHMVFDPLVGVELLPVNTKVKVSYLGASVEKQQNTKTNSHLEFNTIKLTVSLVESDNDDITASATWEYRFGWGTHMAFDPLVGVELLPVNTKVKVSYLGASVEKQQNTKTNSHLDFNTIKLTASLVESDNDDITAAATWQYRFGWGIHMVFDPLVGVELLPVNTKVKVNYLGSSVEKQQNTKSNSHIAFNTIKVTANLADGATDLTAAANWQYRYGWGAYSALDPSGEELLPVNTKVRYSLLGSSGEKQQNVKSVPEFNFAYAGPCISNTLIQTIPITACDSLLAPDGSVLNATGLYTLNIPSGGNCDSVVIYDLTIISGSIDSISVSACGSYTWPANGQIYQTSGIYAAQLQNTSGCDSVVTLDLSINPVDTINISATACESFMWSQNGQTYSSSGNYILVDTNTNGCFRINTLNLTINNCDSAQAGDPIIELWGMTSEGGLNDRGVIFKTNSSGENFEVVYNFSTSIGERPEGDLLYADNGLIYGMTARGGINNEGVIFSINPVTGDYQVIHDFDQPTGFNPKGSLLQAADGNLYGMTLRGGTFNNGVIFSFNPTTSTYTKLHDYNMSNGKLPNGSLIEASDGHLYGLTSAGGVSNDGVLYSFNISSHIFRKLHDFNSTNGFMPKGNLVQAANGKLYGLTARGGSGDFGTIFSYDIPSGIHTKLHDFDNLNGNRPSANMIEASDGKLYGMTHAGGTNDYGLIFSLDPFTEVFEIEHEFDQFNDGSYPWSSLLQASNGLFYGTTLLGGPGDDGVLFEYDYINDLFQVTHDFDQLDGVFSYSSLIEVATCKSYLIHDTVVTSTNYLWPVNNQTYASSGNYLSSLPNLSGCDSVFKLNLTIRSTDTIFQSVTECEEYAWALNGQTYTASGTYYHIRNNPPVDSVFVLDLLILKSPRKGELMQLGNDILGDAAEDLSGWAVSMPDAQTLGVGAYQNDDAGINAGQVKVFSWNGSQWMQKGNDIDGESAGDESGYSLSMPDATTVAIGAPKNDVNGIQTGHVRVYSWNGSSWVQKGNDIDGDAFADYFGLSVSMPNANVVAIGAPNNDAVGNNAGLVRVFRWDGSSWQQQGSDILGEAADDKNGYSVNMPDENTLAIGAHQNDGNGANAGHARIFQWNGSAWIQKGNAIEGQAAGDRAGNSVHMPDANTIAVGSPENDATAGNAGQVRVFEWNGMSWNQKGSDLNGSSGFDQLGFAVVMPDVNTVATSAPIFDINGSEAGRISFYQWNGSSWMEQSTYVEADTAFDFVRSFTNCISMPNTQIIAVGAAGNDLNGNLAGQTRVFKFNQTADYTDSVESCLSYTWPVNGQTYNSSGIYTDILVDMNACDSTVELYLVIHQTDSVFQQAVACDNFTWPVNGQTYTSSGFYSSVRTNTRGCDSTIYLDLRINNTDTAHINAFACNTYTWSANGQNYLSSGIYETTLINASGCDSVVRLNLILNQGDSTYQPVTACDSYTWPANGQTYSSSGTYIINLVNQSGCDSLIFLDLQIIPSNQPKDWGQVGASINGSSADDYLGRTIYMADDSTLAVAAPGDDGNGLNSGEVKVYTWSGSDWIQRGSVIQGEAARDEFGQSISMPDKNTLAVSSIFNDGNGKGYATGHVRVYTWNNSSWVQKGLDIDGEAASDQSGIAISMPDANTLAIGAQQNSGNGTSSGHTRVFKWSGSAWIQKGSDIDGEASTDF